MIKSRYSWNKVQILSENSHWLGFHSLIKIESVCSQKNLKTFRKVQSIDKSMLFSKIRDQLFLNDKFKTVEIRHT